MKRLLHIAVFTTSAAVILATTRAPAEVFWTADGVPVSTSSAVQEAPSLVRDGHGGAIITWSDQISGSDFNIVAQRIDASGTPVWTSPVVVCGAPFDQYFPAIAADGSGGAIIAWQDLRSSDGYSRVYVQKLNASGVVQWAADGVPISTESPGDQYSPAVASDGAGGAWIAWRDTRNDLEFSSTDIYLRRITSDGSVLGAVAIPLALSLLEDDRDVLLYPDGGGGVIAVWQDGRNVATSGKDLYAQRAGCSGELLWGAQGLALCNAAGDQRYPDVVPDGSGGILVCWDDRRNGVDYDVYVQRVSGSGTLSPGWPANGVAACAWAGNQVVPALVADGSGGAIVAWTDARGGSAAQYYDIYAQRVSGGGTPAWGAGGVAVCSAQGWQGRVRSASDTRGGAYIAWLDNRIDPSNATWNYDIYAQRVDPNGASLWDVNGVGVCTAGGRQDLHKTNEDGFGNSMVVWQDSRSGTFKHTYVQKIGVSLPVSGLAAARSMPDGIHITTLGPVVTAVFGSSFYVEDSDRTAGMRVYATGVSEGQAVTIVGELDTVNGERALVEATASNPAPATVPAPLFMANRWLGGSMLGPYVPGITGASGLNNVGLLVTTSGSVLTSGPGYACIDDGSDLNDGLGTTGLKVDTTYLTQGLAGYAVVTGISSTEEPSPGTIIRVLRPRRDGDVRLY